MNKNPKFSIIVPVFNVETYLSKCLQSLINQTLYDIEIICVDDGSTDASLDILKNYAKLDDRITIIHKENGGLPSARNAGIEVAEGDYYLFVDSDDYLSENACDRLYEEVMDTSADIVIFGTSLFPWINDADMSWIYNNLQVRQVNYHKKVINALFKENASKPFVWNGCYKKNFFTQKKLRFDEEMKYGEDMVFLFSVFPLAEEISYIPDHLYNYRCERKDSLMGMAAINFEKKLEWHIIIVEKIFTKWLEQGRLNQYKDELAKWAIDFIYGDLKTNKIDELTKGCVAGKLLDQLYRYDIKFSSIKEWYYKDAMRELKKMALNK